MTSQPISERISASAAMLIVGVIADVSAAALFLVSPETRSWLQDKYMWVTLLALLLVAAVLSLLNLLQSQRNRIADLSAASRNLEAKLADPSPHDVAMFEELANHASPQSGLMIWLKDAFLGNSVRDSEITSLDRMVRHFEREPRGFNDAELEMKYRAFLRDARALLDVINSNVFPVRGADRYSVPPEWEWERPDQLREALDGISEAHDDVIRSYDEFMLSAQRKGLKGFVEVPVGESS